MLRKKERTNTRNRAKPPAKNRKPGFVSRMAGVDWGKVRISMVGVAFACLWALLWARAYQVQILRGPEYAEMARKQHVATEKLTGRRGSILDRSGNVLARSVQARSVYVRPHEVADASAAAARLAPVLGQSESALRSHLASRKPFVWLARKVSDKTAESVREAGIRGVYLSTEYERIYPFRHLAGQLLGFVDVDDKGIEGLEKAFEDKLTGLHSKETLQRDARGNRLYTKPGETAESLGGEDVQLTIDTQVQFFTEEALAKGVAEIGAKWAGCMVVDVPSGDILAWAEYPFFNPNLSPREFSPMVRRNKLAMDALEQGSTIKPFVVAAALEEGIVSPTTPIKCEKGRWKFRGVTIRDDTGAHDTLTVHEVLTKSSNIGSAKIGLMLGADRYHDYLIRLGFGTRSSLPLAGENKGILRQPRQWAELDLASSAFGQSFSATIVQMAQAYLTLANDGVRRDLRLTRHDEPSAGEGQRLFSRDTMEAVRAMMHEAVDSGTGRRARIAGLAVGGKTGTAQKAKGDTYGDGRVGSFAGFAPLDNPRYLVVVVFDEPEKSQYGGVIAAPVFREVVTRTMAYHGTLPEESALAATATSRDVGSATGTNRSAKASPAPAGTGHAAARSAGGSVPSVVGLPVRAAVEDFARLGLVPQVRGAGNAVVRQSPKPGASLAEAALEECTLWLGERS